MGWGREGNGIGGRRGWGRERGSGVGGGGYGNCV